MRKLLLSVLALGAVACQPQPATTSPAASTTPAPALPSPAFLATTDSTAAVLALTRQVNLAPGWGNVIPGSPPVGSMEGFYGPDNYRISFRFDTVRRDSRQPNVFHFRGRDRYKKVITPFTGTITVTRLAPLPDTVGLPPGQSHRAYSAFANFELREDPTIRGAGWCRGRFSTFSLVLGNGCKMLISKCLGLGSAIRPPVAAWFSRVPGTTTAPAGSSPFRGPITTEPSCPVY